MHRISNPFNKAIEGIQQWLDQFSSLRFFLNRRFIPQVFFLMKYSAKQLYGLRCLGIILKREAFDKFNKRSSNMYETAAKRCFGQLLLAIATIAVTHNRSRIVRSQYVNDDFS